MKRIGKALADYLIDEGLVRTPQDEIDFETGESLPVIFVEPTDGAPSPEDLENEAETDITLTIQSSGGFGSDPYNGFLDRRTFNLLFRCKRNKEKDLIDFSNSIDAILDDKRAWIMADLRIEIAQLYRPLQALPVSDPEQGSVFISEYFFLIRKESLQD